MITVTSADGTKIVADRRGDGPPLVLISGAFSSRVAFEPLAALLAPRFTVYAVDRRGRGDSGDIPPYAVEREIEDLAAIIGAAGGGPVFAFGHSSGAGLALEAAARGLSIAKLALYEPPLIVDDSRPPAPADLAARVGAMVVAGRRTDAVAYWMEQTVQLPREMIEQAKRGPDWAAMEAVVHTAPYDATIMANYMTGKPLPDGQWSSVTIPALILDGELSPEWQHHGVDALAGVLTDARRYTFAGAGHGAPPEQVAPVLTSWFAGDPIEQ